MLGDLFKSQKLRKYPFRKSKGLFSREFILVTNLLVDVLVKKSVALVNALSERVDSPEQIFYQSFSLGAPEGSENYCCVLDTISKHPLLTSGHLSDSAEAHFWSLHVTVPFVQEQIWQFLANHDSLFCKTIEENAVNVILELVGRWCPLVHFGAV